MEQVNKYANGKIYKLTNDINDLVYYGSTIKTLNERLSQHTSNYKSYKKGNHHYLTSFELFKNDAVVNIELVEAVNCNSRQELELLERIYIETNECINKNVPTRTQKEYNEANKDKIKVLKKEYYENNKDYFLKAHKEYRENNKDKLTEYQKEYRIKNKESNYQPFICDCGKEIKKYDLVRHKKSKSHLKRILELNNN